MSQCKVAYVTCEHGFADQSEALGGIRNVLEGSVRLVSGIQLNKHREILSMLGLVAHASYANTWGAESGGLP